MRALVVLGEAGGVRERLAAQRALHGRGRHVAGVQRRHVAGQEAQPVELERAGGTGVALAAPVQLHKVGLQEGAGAEAANRDGGVPRRWGRQYHY